jgi:hypothetical protein
MSLHSLSVEELDQLAQRAVNLATLIRQMSRIVCDDQLQVFRVTTLDVEASMGLLEQWADQANAELHLQVLQQRARRRALEIAV